MGLFDWILRRRRDEDLQAEIRAHLSMATQERVDQGDDPRRARLAALKEFGNVTLTREATRQSWGGGWREPRSLAGGMCEAIGSPQHTGIAGRAVGRAERAKRAA